MTADPQIERLAKLDSGAISDALDSLGLSGAVTGIPPLAGGRKIAGRAATVRLGDREPEAGPKRHLCTGAVEAGGPGTVIVVEQRTGIDAAAWGGVLSNAAQYRGIAGVVVEGPARDIDESETLGFPVFARSATARTARGRIWEQAWDCPVTVGKILVSPGDLVVADKSAVVFVAANRAEEVLTAAERIAAKETLMIRSVREGTPAGTVMGADYESLLREK